MAADNSPIIVDASVVVKWYVPERDADEARVLRDEHVNGAVSLSAPALMPFEVTNALRYSDLIDPSGLAHATRSLSKYGVNLVPFADVGDVISVAEAVDVPAYDASYLALADTYDSRVYTTDAQLVDAAIGTEYEGNVVHVENFGA